MEYAKRTKPDGSVEYGTNYGAKTFYSDLEDLTGTGNVWFKEVISGYFDAVPGTELVEIKMEFGKDDQGRAAFVDEYHQYVDAEFEKAMKNAPDEFGKGSLLSVGVADGQAWYEVVKVNPKTCDIEWRGFSPDAYMDQVLGFGGRFDRERIEPLVSRRLALQSIFGP